MYFETPAILGPTAPGSSYSTGLPTPYRTCTSSHKVQGVGGNALRMRPLVKGLAVHHLALKWVQIPQRQQRRQTVQALAPKEGATHILTDSLADGLHLVEEVGEFAYGGITPGGIDPDIP